MRGMGGTAARVLKMGELDETDFDRGVRGFEGERVSRWKVNQNPAELSHLPF